MKVFISADIEGVAGITAPEEADPAHADIKYFKDQMTREVKAACDGALAAGAKAIVVKDAHWTGRNIDPRALPECVEIVRGWSGHPYSMMAELDKSFSAVVYVGYHARAGSAGNPLAHTMSGRLVAGMRLNGVPASEFLLNTMTATMLGVPVAFLSGDEALCSEVRGYNDAIETVATLRGVGNATVSIHPDVAVRRIEAGVGGALKRATLKQTMRPLPSEFVFEIDYVKAREAYGRSFYPGAELIGEGTVRIKTRDYFDVLRMMQFCVK